MPTYREVTTDQTIEFSDFKQTQQLLGTLYSGFKNTSGNITGLLGNVSNLELSSITNNEGWCTIEFGVGDDTAMPILCSLTKNMSETERVCKFKLQYGSNSSPISITIKQNGMTEVEPPAFDYMYFRIQTNLKLAIGIYLFSQHYAPNEILLYIAQSDEYDGYEDGESHDLLYGIPVYNRAYVIVNNIKAEGVAAIKQTNVNINSYIYVYAFINGAGEEAGTKDAYVLYVGSLRVELNTPTTCTTLTI